MAENETSLSEACNLVLIANATGNERIQVDAINKLLDAARSAATELEALRKRCEAVEAALRDCLQAMDVARDTIQPITQAKVKLHGLDPATANKLDAAASKALAAIAAAQEPSHG